MTGTNKDQQPTEHLNKIDQAMKAAKKLLAQHGYPDDLRTVVVIGFIDQMVEHHTALLLLIRSSLVGSGFALVRTIVEGMYRALWINCCATDGAIEKFEKDDKVPLTLAQMAHVLDDKYGTEGFFAELKERGWHSLSSYVHTGMLQLGRRFTRHDPKPAYTKEEIYEVTTTATTCILLLVGRFLAVQNRAEESIAPSG
jgi:hypothetical protein